MGVAWMDDNSGFLTVEGREDDAGIRGRLEAGMAVKSSLSMERGRLGS